VAKRNHRFIYLLNVAQRRVQNWARVEKGATTAAQAGALFVLGRDGGGLVGDVARALGLGLPGASGLVDRMVEAGLVVRRPDERDGRSHRLHLTQRGRAERVAAMAAAAEMNHRLSDGFTEAELEVVARWLTDVGRKFAKEEDK
jgi:DNA-binding MarR family transcriptional regulator